MGKLYSVNVAHYLLGDLNCDQLSLSQDNNTRIIKILTFMAFLS